MLINGDEDDEMRTSRWVTLGAVALLAAALSAQETPTESYVKLMRAASASRRSIGQNVEAKNYDGVATDAAALQEVFAEVGKFWAERDVEDAMASCRVTYQAAAAIETAAKAMDDEAIAASVQALGGGCQSCHAAHREGPRGGPYTIK